MRDKEKRAFLATPREEFSRSSSAARTYAHSFLDIGCGVTISGPHIVGRMTSELDVQPGDRVLEIGTGSGYQAALLTYLTPHVYSVEIIPSLSEATDRILDRLTDTKYIEFARVLRKTADGYFGWPEHAPFDKIIVTAGIDHIPPPLVKQLADGGVMVIPVGPPGAQSLLKLTKTRSETGRIRIKRHDIYAAQCSRAEKQRCKRKVSFVALTKISGRQNRFALGPEVGHFGDVSCRCAKFEANSVLPELPTIRAAPDPIRGPEPQAQAYRVGSGPRLSLRSAGVTRKGGTRNSETARNIKGQQILLSAPSVLPISDTYSPTGPVR